MVAVWVIGKKDQPRSSIVLTNCCVSQRSVNLHVRWIQDISTIKKIELVVANLWRVGEYNEMCGTRSPPIFSLLFGQLHACSSLNVHLDYCYRRRRTWGRTPHIHCLHHRQILFTNDQILVSNRQTDGAYILNIFDIIGAYNLWALRQKSEIFDFQFSSL